MTWTTPTAGVPLDDLCQEIALGIYERGGNFENQPAITAGRKLEEYKYQAGLRGWQTQISGMIDGTLEARPHIQIWAGHRFRWINHEAGPLNEDATEFVYFDLETFADVAGLHYPGLWRRKQNVGDAYSYGPIERGDILGSWIIEDLQLALSSLKWVKLDTHYEELAAPCARGFSYFSQADAEAKYDASGWDSGFWNYTVEAWAKHTMNWTLLRQMTTIKPSVGRKVCFFNSGSGVLDSYFLGDAVAAGTFDANGDAGIVEGIGSTTLRLARTSNYPGDLAAGGYFPVTNTSRPTWPVSGTERGYKLPLKSDGDCVLTVQHIYKPVFTNA